MSNMVEIGGNTFPVKDKIKELGGKWDGTKKVWMVPELNAEAAKALVANAPKSNSETKPVMSKLDRIAAAARKRGEKPGTCSICGHQCKYPWTECWDCKEEREMGY